MLTKYFQSRLTTFGFEIKIMDTCVCGKQPQIRSGLQTRPVCKHESVLLLHRIRNAHGLHTHCKRSMCETGVGAETISALLQMHRS